MLKEKKIVRRARRGEVIRQVAAVPFRHAADGGVEVLLVTSGATRRFIVPKGWPMKGRSGKRAAMIEAGEEAGVAGSILRDPLGEYSYWKRLSRQFVRVQVKVYLLEVARELPEWKESARRRRAWLSPDQAAQLIDETQLAMLVATLSAWVSRPPSPMPAATLP